MHVDISGKVDKVKNATAGNVALLDSDGTLTNSTVVGANILFKVSDATAGNVPILNSDGTLVNSTLSAADIVTKVEGATAGNIAVFDSDGKITNSEVAVDGVIKKVAGVAADNIAVFDSDGSLVDSGHNILKILNPVRYGIRIKKTEPDPYARVEYVYDAVNFTPANMDFENDTFNFGSWSDVWFVKDIKPLMLKSDGTVDYYLYENDYSIKANGEDVTTPSTAADSDSDVANTEYDGNAMVQFPLVWIKRYEDADYVYEIVSNVKYDDDYYAFAHTNANGDIKDYFYWGMFEASGNTTKLRSLSGQQFTSTHTLAQEIAACVANGAGYDNTNGTGNGWYVITWSQNELIRTLLYLLGKTTAPKSSFGYGYFTGDSSTALLSSGLLNDKGMFYGINNANSAVKVFHIENHWGNTIKRGAGMMWIPSTAKYYAKMTPENGGYSITSPSNMQLVDSYHQQRVYWQYVKTASISEYGLFPTTFGAATNTYYAQMVVHDEFGGTSTFASNYNKSRPISGSQAVGFGSMGIMANQSGGNNERNCRISFIG